MAYNGLSEILTGEQTVIVPKSEYEELVRDSEKVRIFKEIDKATRIISARDFTKIVLGLNKESEEK